MNALKSILVAAGIFAASIMSAQPGRPQTGSVVQYPDAHDPVAA